MKKLLTILFALTLLLSLAACTAGERTPGTETKDPTTVTEPEAVEVPEDKEAPTAAEAEETEPEADAADDKEATSGDGPEVDLVFEEAKPLIGQFLMRLMRDEVDETEALFAPEAFENYTLEDLADAEPTVHEILWEDAFLELRLADESYVTLELTPDADGYWLFRSIVPTAEFFKREGNVQLHQEDGDNWHFRNLSSLPGTQFENSGDVILVPADSKRIVKFERWTEDEEFRARVELLEFHGNVMPAELFYRQGDTVINNEKFESKFGIFFYQYEASRWIDRVMDLLGIE